MGRDGKPVNGAPLPSSSRKYFVLAGTAGRAAGTKAVSAAGYVQQLIPVVFVGTPHGDICGCAEYDFLHFVGIR